MRKRSWAALAVLAALIAVVAGCGPKKEKEPEPDSATVAQPTNDPPLNEGTGGSAPTTTPPTNG